MKFVPEHLHSDPRLVASLLHAYSGKYYDGMPYIVHLQKVYEAYRLMFREPNAKQLFIIYFHDTIEDCGITYNDVVSYARLYSKYNLDMTLTHGIDNSVIMADAVYALTNMRGKTRKERQNVEWYACLCENTEALKVKYADKFANLKHSIESASSMRGVYLKEWFEFHKNCTTLVRDESVKQELQRAYSHVEELISKLV